MVLHNAVVLARHVDIKRVHTDLTYCPGTPPQFGRFNPVLGEWIDIYTEEVCRQQLRDWPIITPTPGGQRVPTSHITVAGRRWLEGTT